MESHQRNECRTACAVAELDEYFCIAGGYADYRATNSVEIYDPRKDAWTLLPPLNKPRSFCAIFKWNESLYAMGGHSVLERFDSWKNSWTEVHALNQNKDSQNS